MAPAGRKGKLLRWIDFRVARRSIPVSRAFSFQHSYIFMYETDEDKHVCKENRYIENNDMRGEK